MAIKYSDLNCFWRWLAAVIRDDSIDSPLLKNVKFTVRRGISPSDVALRMSELHPALLKLSVGLGQVRIICGSYPVPLPERGPVHEIGEWDKIATGFRELFVVDHLPLHLPFWSEPRWPQESPDEWQRFLGSRDLRRLTGLLEQQAFVGLDGEVAWWKHAYDLWVRPDLHPYFPPIREMRGFVKQWEPHIKLPILDAAAKVLGPTAFKR